MGKVPDNDVFPAWLFSSVQIQHMRRHLPGASGLYFASPVFVSLKFPGRLGQSQLVCPESGRRLETLGALPQPVASALLPAAIWNDIRFLVLELMHEAPAGRLQL